MQSQKIGHLQCNSLFFLKVCQCGNRFAGPSLCLVLPAAAADFSSEAIWSVIILHRVFGISLLVAESETLPSFMMSSFIDESKGKTCVKSSTV